MRSHFVRTLQALRLKDWYGQVLIHWACALAYAIGVGPEPVAYLHAILLTTAILALLLSGGYLLNNVADHDADSHKGGPYLRGRGEVRRATTVAILLIGGALALVHGAATTPWLPVIAWGQLLLGLAYSFPPVRLKVRGLWGVLSAAVAQRIPAFWMLVAIAPFDGLMAALVTAWLLLVGLVFIVEHQLEDLRSDTESGTRTWLVETGRRTGLGVRGHLYGLFHSTSVLLGVVLIVRCPTAGGASGTAIWLVCALILSVAIRSRYAGSGGTSVLPQRRPA